jgi:hypothetical protein
MTGPEDQHAAYAAGVGSVDQDDAGHGRQVVFEDAKAWQRFRDDAEDGEALRRLRSVLPIGSTLTIQTWVDDAEQVFLAFAVRPDLPEEYGSGASIAAAADRCREALATPTIVVAKPAHELMGRLVASGYRPMPRSARSTDLQHLEQHNGATPGCDTCAGIWASTG